MVNLDRGSNTGVNVGVGVSVGDGVREGEPETVFLVVGSGVLVSVGSGDGVSVGCGVGEIVRVIGDIVELVGMRIGLAV